MLSSELISSLSTIGDGILFFLVLYKYIGLYDYRKLLFSGILAGALVNLSYSVYNPFSPGDNLHAVVILFAAGSFVFRITQPKAPLQDFLFIFSVGYFSNITTMILVTLVCALKGITTQELIMSNHGIELTLHILQYIVFLSLGIYVLRVKERIKLISEVGSKIYSIVTIGRIVICTIFILLTVSIDAGTSHLFQTGAFNTVPRSALHSTLALAMIFFLVCFFQLLSYYSMKQELLQHRVRQHELLNERLSTIVDSLCPIKHGIRNRFAVIHALACANANDALAEYVKSCTHDFLPTERLHVQSLCNIENPDLSALLSLYIQKIEALNIVYRMNIDFQCKEIAIRNSDLCTLISILMENAIEASVEMASKAEITIDIRNTNAKFELSIGNYYTAPIAVNQLSRRGYTTKSPGRGHGLWQARGLIGRYSNVTNYFDYHSEWFLQTIVVLSVAHSEIPCPSAMADAVSFSR